MIERFKVYLENAFRAIKPTAEAMEYREEVLSTLLDRAADLSAKGMANEDDVFNECIASLGDFASTLQDFESKRADVKKGFLKASQIALIAVGIMFVITAAFLAISIVTGEWGRTWLIEVGGAFGIVICGICAFIPRQIKGKKFGLIRLETAVNLVLLFVFVFLLVSIMTGAWGRTWLLFFVMIITVLAVDTVLAYVTGAKTAILDVLVLVPVTTTFLYVGLGLMGVSSGNYWGIYWILPMCGGVADFVIGTVKYVFWLKKKQAQEIEKEKYDEKYYTSWKQ